VTSETSKTLRAGSAEKRAAILAAAGELFVRNGVERTSMDAVAAQARVSKRTVYDYFGDKESLLWDVIEQTGVKLIAALRDALEQHLGDEAGIEDAAGLEQAFVGFARELNAKVIVTSDYATVFTLISRERSVLPDLTEHPLATAPEEAVAERIAHYDRVGILDAPDPRLAADHFNALTILLALSDRDPFAVDRDAVDRSMTAGVAAFMRAYVRR
jgi:TetR/AcrR family transcriptional repressor of mexJK operon